MKVIVRNVEYGGVVVDLAIEHQLPISIDKETDGALRLYVWDEDGTDTTIGWFAPNGWRGAWIDDSTEAVPAQSLADLPDNSEFDDEHPF